MLGIRKGNGLRVDTRISRGDRIAKIVEQMVQTVIIKYTAFG